MAETQTSFGRLLTKNATTIAIATVTLLAILAIIFFRQQVTANADAKTWLFHSYEVKEHIQVLINRLAEAQMSQRGYILTGDEKYLQPYRDAISVGIDEAANVDVKNIHSSIADELEILKKLTADNPVQQDYLVEMSKASAAFLDFLAANITERKAQDMALILSNFYQSKQLMDNLRRLHAKMVTEENRLLEQRTQTEAQAVQRNSQIIFIIVGTFYIVAVLAIRLCQKAEQGAQAKFLEQADYIKNILDTMIDGLLVVDDKGNVQSLNPAAENMFGYQPGEAAGLTVQTLMPEFRIDPLDTQLKNSRNTKVTESGREVIARRKDGGMLPIELSISEMWINGKRFFTGSMRDISERKKGDRELQRFIQALKQSNRELDDFAYIASHDLKEPLRGLSNNAKFLQEDFQGHLDEGTKKRLDRMTYLCQRLERLVDDLLYFSRLGRQELAIQTTDLNDIIKDISAMMETALREANAQIVVPEALPVIVCDLPRVTEIFRNLISNAIKYNKSAEKRIEIGCADTKKLLPNNDNTGSAFYVRDNGIGIPTKFHDDIFRIFKRLNEEDDNVKGTGVGLTFVRKIVERHGGRIWLDSEEGRGTTFYFTLNTKKEAVT